MCCSPPSDVCLFLLSFSCFLPKVWQVCLFPSSSFSLFVLMATRYSIPLATHVTHTTYACSIYRDYMLSTMSHTIITETSHIHVTYTHNIASQHTLQETDIYEGKKQRRCRRHAAAPCPAIEGNAPPPMRAQSARRFLFTSRRRRPFNICFTPAVVTPSSVFLSFAPSRHVCQRTVWQASLFCRFE